MNPTKRITDPSFVYVPSVKTDIRVLFDRVRAEIAEAKANPQSTLIIVGAGGSGGDGEWRYRRWDTK